MTGQDARCGHMPPQQGPRQPRPMALREAWQSGGDGHLSREAPEGSTAKLLTGTDRDGQRADKG